jgi:hypothetical protein
VCDRTAATSVRVALIDVPLSVTLRVSFVPALVQQSCACGALRLSLCANTSSRRPLLESGGAGYK